MNKLISDPLFVNFIIPMITVALGIFIRYVSRNDGHKQISKDDFAFGFNISITALILFLTSASKLAQQLGNSQSQLPQQTIQAKLAEFPYIALAIVIGLWGLSTVVRKVGWESDGKLKLVLGIIIPDIVGIAFLLFVVGWIN